MQSLNRCRDISFRLLLLLVLSAGKPGVAEKGGTVRGKGTFNYTAKEAAKLIDFSYCGYAANSSPIPFIGAVYAVDPVKGDATDLIQQAIDKVSSLPLNENGFRGAVLLKKGTFRVSGQLVIAASGVVLRGSGDEPDGTVLTAAGNSRRTLIEIKGADDLEKLTTVYKVTDPFVPAGAKKVTLENTSGLKEGDQIFIKRPCTKKWISTLGMDQFVIRHADLVWLEGSRDVRWDRTIAKIEDNTVCFNEPITTELDASFGQSEAVEYRWPGRIENVGIENLRCVSDYDAANAKDEEHSWICVNVSNARNVWLRDITAVHFAGSMVMLQPTTSYVTVENCKYLAPVSEIGGLRRVSFYNAGQLNLIKNCYAENGRHDFAAGFCSAGPNIFKDCTADNAFDYSGSIESWVCGVLFDNVIIHGNAIRLTNVKQDMQGAGWAASQGILWNCQAAELDAANPPFSTNSIYGGLGSIPDTGCVLVDPLRIIAPRSLFDEQLETRTGLTAYQQLCARFQYPAENPKLFNSLFIPKQPTQSAKKRIEIINGRLVCNGKTVWGGHLGTDFWQGNLVPDQAKKRYSHLTRFAPGRTGTGLTDDIAEIVENMRETGRPFFVHQPALWYDRRRCDHMIVKRMNGDVWGPLYEMPWARSGQGEAWDGLSKYDLTKFNPWYFARIREFADACDQNGFIFFNEVYNNHNVVEAAAHWVDFPWRPANCIQDNGLAEPPPFELSSVDAFRIHIADEFYDVSNPVRAGLHKRYIRQCFNNLKDVGNVIYSPAFQYAGSLEFLKFFLETAREWQAEHGVKLKLALHTGKNITDAILSDPKYRDMIAVIHTGHWTYLKKDGALFAPPAGVNKAFRELIGEYDKKMDNSMPPTSRTLLYKQVREYRDAYPDKVIIAWESGAGPLPVLMAGGGYATYQEEWIRNSPDKNDFDAFVKTCLTDFLWQMIPMDNVVTDQENNWCLANPGKQYLVYSLAGGQIEANIEGGNYQYRWFKPSGQRLSEPENINTSGRISLEPPGKKSALLLIQKVD